MTDKYDEYKKKNSIISLELSMPLNFDPEMLSRLNAFLREDELNVDGIISTSQDTAADTFKNQQHALESAKIELEKICQPQLSFSMSMANIYALSEFEPIIDQFQLGKMIKVGIRPDYIKKARLLKVDINFDDFSDFSCEFGDLTDLYSQTDIHADMLANAISAGKSVAENSAQWTQGSNKANSIDLRLQEGLLNSIEALKNLDGTQHAYIDKYGIHLEVVNPDTGEVGDKRVWLVNNQIVFTDDGFETSKTVLGEFEVGGETYYGLLAQAIIAGHIEGSTMIGGTIKIGEYYENGTKKHRFEVDEDGNVTMNAASITGYIAEGDKANIIKDAVDESSRTMVEIYGSNFVHYGTCENTAGTKNKTVSCDSISELYDGAVLSVKFTYANTAQQPTLNVSKTGDKPVFADSKRLTGKSDYDWSAGSVVTFVYDGSGWNISGSGSLSSITQTAEDIKLEVKEVKDGLTAAETNIAQNAYNITLAVTKGNLGTEITQNADSVRIAWNDNSDYIKFENGEIRIYDENHSLLTKYTNIGTWYYYSNTKLGKIGTNNMPLENHYSQTTFRGIVFDLEYEAGYMCWAAKDTSDADSYSVKFLYNSGHDMNKQTVESAFGPRGLYFFSTSYLNNNPMYFNDNIRTYGSGILASNEQTLNLTNESKVNDCGVQLVSKRTDGYSTVFSCYPNRYEFSASKDYLIDCYNDIDMHKYQVLNSSDVRLKTNIADTNIDALSLINQIEMKEFDWIDTGEHEDIGIIAQQLQQIIPSLVHEDADGKMSIKVNKFIPYLIKALQEITEYITGDISVFSTRNKWVDLYTIEEKKDFISKYISDGLSKQTVEKEEEPRQVLLPINYRQGDDTNE